MDMDLCEDQSQLMVTKSSKSSINPPERKIAKRGIKMHMLIFEEGGLPDKSKVYYKSRGEILRTGEKLGDGIFCYCCNDVVSPSKFEAHANMASRRKPYENIFLSNGVSLHQYALSLSEKVAKKNDVCVDCQYGGDLLSCDRCHRSFHKECSSEKTTPLEKQFCKHCQNSRKRVRSVANAVAGRRVSGVKPIEQIVERNPNKGYLVACVLCSSSYFSEDGFNDQTVIVCDQCEKEYHIGCLKEKRDVYLEELPSCNWFCSTDCGNLHSTLKKMLTCEPEKVPDSLMDSIQMKLNDSDADSITNLDVKWILICGKDASEENKLLLTEAVNIFHDCFEPIIDLVTGSDFIPSMAYGMPMGASDFSGVYTAMLTIDSKVVTAGMFRILGQEITELPLVATSQPYQRKGYFQLFLACFEKLLSYLNIEKLVIPAANDVKALWTNKFGFNNVTRQQLRKYRETRTSMVEFQRTALLEKEVPKGQTTFDPDVIFSLNME